MSIFKACVSGKSKKATVMYSTKDAMMKTDHKSKDDPNMTEWSGKKESSSDHSEDDKIAFWNSGLCVCIKCGQRNLVSQEVRAGVRNNGEAHGTDVFTCKTERCDWTISLLFDDAYEDCWHYEAMGWPRGIKGYPVCYMVLWAEKHKLPQTVINKIKEDKVTGSRLLEMAEKGLEEGLGVSKKVAAKIHKALADKRGAVLK